MKETHYKLRHRVTALIAAAVMLCSMLPGAAFAEETAPQPIEEVVQMEQQTESSEADNGQTDESSPDPGAEEEATPETAEEQPAEEEISAAVVGAELYADLPDAPIGSYIGSEGLPVATGYTKIGISEWPESQLEENSGSYLTAAALDNDGLTMTAPLLDGADYAIVPIMAQVEYPADGSSTDIILPDDVMALDFYGAPAADADALLHSSYHETSAAVMGLYVQAAVDFSVKFAYTDPQGKTQTKTLNVTIDREHTVASPLPDAEIATYARRPVPSVTSGKITKVQKVNGTWLIWFNDDEAYCCTPGADGQPKNCPPYTYINTSMVGADQYIPGDHYGNQFRIWGGLTQLSLGMLDAASAVFSIQAPTLLDFCRTIYTDAQMTIIENYPDSTAAAILTESAQALLNGMDTYASARGYYTYIYQPGRAGWQTVAVIGPEIGDDEPNPEPIVQEIYANWEAPAQTANGSFDFDYGITTDKVQLKTVEKVDGATIEIEPITKSGTIDGGTWNISPADKQTVTTGGHTNDDNYQNNGGVASASWTLHYSVSKTTDSRSGRVGPYTTQDEADAAADSARDSAIAELQSEAQRMVDNAIASAKAELASIKFRYEEVGVPYGFEMYWGSNGSKQTISVPANSNNAYPMKNDEWSLQVNIKKTDSETGNQIAADAQYEIFQWDVVTGKYQPTGGYNTYSVQRQNDGTYAVINGAAYATTDSMRHTLYYTQRNQGKFIIVETKAPTGYFGDWTDINHPGIANTPLGKRGYYIEITEDKDNSVIWLNNADYNADIAVADMGGTKLVTSTGVETTVTIYDTAKDPSRTYNTDNSGKAANEDSYTVTPTDGVMKNDRTLGEISISKVDLDAVRYIGGRTAHDTALASGQAHGDATLDGAVYDLYAAEDITHPDGVTGVVDYAKIVNADGNPIWHTTIRDNSGQWVSDYLPVLKKDHLVASAEIKDGWLCFSNLYLGKYYVVERSTGVVIPLRDGALAVSGTYPTVDSRTKAATGQTAALAKNGSGQYTDWVYKNQFSTVSNVVLNELDWWIASQWETFPTKTKYSVETSRYTPLRRTSKMKEVFIVRYADDFKLFCKTRSDAEKLFAATKQWLAERLKLEVSKEKSKIVNLKKGYSDFLGFKLKLRPKSGKWVLKSHMTDKAQKKCRENIRAAIGKIGREPNQWSVMRFNAMVLGLHEYYKIATNVYVDFDRIAFDVRKMLLCRTKSHRNKTGLRSQAFQNFYGDFTGRIFNVAGIALFPINGIKTTPPMCFSQDICNYSARGREKIHEMQKAINPMILQALMQYPIQGQSTELNDNRISLYVAQRGKCSVSKEPLLLGDMEVHHIVPRANGGKDNYANLSLVTKDVHKLIHATEQSTIQKYLDRTKDQKLNMTRLNKFRVKAGNCKLENR